MVNKKDLTMPIEPSSDTLLEKLLIQTSDSIQSLHKLTTQIDERVKQLKEKSEEITKRLDDICKVHNDTVQRIAILESKDLEDVLDDVQKCENKLIEIEKKILEIENAANRSEGRWKHILNFAIQIGILIAASWILLKLNLTSPPTP